MTTTRPEVSKKNDYYISRERYYELKHFCLQYPEWKRDYKALALKGVRSPNLEIPRVGKTTNQLSKVETDAMAMEELSRHIMLVEATAVVADAEISNYILQAVTEGKSYEYMLLNCGIPCSRDTFYKRYRKFFWLLNSVRG